VQPIAVAVVHGSPPIREALADLLGRQAGVRVVGAYPTTAAMAGGPPADVVVCDLASARAGAIGPVAPARLLVFDVADEDRTIIDCVQVGALRAGARSMSLPPREGGGTLCERYTRLPAIVPIARG
jgi:DNA-binding NarL/FixJ family response regulator